MYIDSISYLFCCITAPCTFWNSFHLVASSLQIACCYKVPYVHHLFPISRTVDVDPTIGDSGTSIMVLDIGTEVVNFKALVCGQTACHPLALAV